jgi:uncharacterized protein with PQ loop repeat
MNILLALESLLLLAVVYLKITGDVNMKSLIMMVISFVCFLAFYTVTLKDLKK